MAVSFVIFPLLGFLPPLSLVDLARLVYTGVDNHGVGEAEQSYRLVSPSVRAVKGTASVAFEGSCKVSGEPKPNSVGRW